MLCAEGLPTSPHVPVSSSAPLEQKDFCLLCLLSGPSLPCGECSGLSDGHCMSEREPLRFPREGADPRSHKPDFSVGSTFLQTRCLSIEFCSEGTVCGRSPVTDAGAGKTSLAWSRGRLPSCAAVPEPPGHRGLVLSSTSRRL